MESSGMDNAISVIFIEFVSFACSSRSSRVFHDAWLASMDGSKGLE